MNQNDIAYWKVDFNEQTQDQIQSPKYIELSEQEVGFTLDEQLTFERDFKNHLLFDIMRVKRIFVKLNESNGHRIGVGLHKFKQTVKMYLHFKGFIIRFQLADIGKWFKLLFYYKEDYHQNALKLRGKGKNWGLVKRYLHGVLKDNQKLRRNQFLDTSNHYNGDETELKANPMINFWEEVNEWRDLDTPFKEKDKELTKRIKKYLKDKQ